jgi:hypothetical protein
MLTYVCRVSGKRLPALGLEARVFVDGELLVTWEPHEGRREFAVSDWREERIPDLARYFTVAEYRAFVECYGVACAKAQLEGAAASSLDEEHALLMDSNGPSDELRLWFLANFAANITDFRNPAAATAGRFAFDVDRFEAFLVDRMGYCPGKSNLSAFLHERVGAFAVDRFRRDVLHERVIAAA